MVTPQDPEAQTSAQGASAGQGRHALTYRPDHGTYEWLRTQAFQQRRSMQAIITDALTALRASWGDTAPEETR